VKGERGCPDPTRQLEIMWCGKVRSETSSNYRQKRRTRKRYCYVQYRHGLHQGPTKGDWRLL